uniref:RWP-RK domain-containing protein n=1 Tax=Kalanchoe fedtschenkoi TaxID=63787 RepID=A0A7N0ZW49_KALFE
MDYGLDKDNFLHAPFQPTDSSFLAMSAASSEPLDYYSDVGLQSLLEFQYESLLLPAAADDSVKMVDGESDQYDSPYASFNVTGHHLLDDSLVFERGGLSMDSNVAETELGQKGSKAKRGRRRCSASVNNSAAELLTWDILSQYFYLPIAQAARELNIGLTLFKKRCRELGVRRWPHRKLMSIKSLIKNVQEMEKESNPAVSKETVRSAVQVLEGQMKMMEVMPDVQLEAQTKRLRQACFKANYKKRRLMIMNGLTNSAGSASSSSQGRYSTSSSSVNHVSSMSRTEAIEQDFKDSEELKSLLFDSLSPSECTFLNDFI